MRGLYIVCEGIDGCGKGTAITAMREWAEEHGLTTFDMELFCKRHNRLPSIDEIPENVIITQEPTYGAIGSCIRRVLTRSEEYTAETLAHAFALDREVYFREIILPARKAGKFIFQERSVMSTLVYQGAMDTHMTKHALTLTGNKLALKNSPDLIFLITCDVATALERICIRAHNKHIGISRFENKEFLSRAQDRFMSSWLIDLFTDTYDTPIITVENDIWDVDEFKLFIIKQLSSLNLTE